MPNIRQCTEASTKHLAHLITTDMREYQQHVTTIRIVDLCSGTGCIPLLLLSLLSKALPNMQFEIVGVDVSPTALALAQRNYTRNLSQYPDTNRHSVSFVQGDLYDWRGLPHWEEEDEYDASVYTVVTCNPPYLSSSTFQQQTERFAKTYITDMALGCLSQEETAELEFQFAPDYDEMAMGRRWWDEDNRFPVEYIQYADYPEAGYYHKAASRAVIFGARMILLEVGGTQQAVNVANMPYDGHQYEGRWGNIEIWGEQPHAPDGGLNITEDEVKRSRNRLWQMNFPGSSNSLEGSIPLRGAGEARSVFYSDRWLRGRE